MACSKASGLQEYLEESEPSPLRRIVEARLATCARCRATFDRVVSTNRRVNAWLARLSPATSVQVDSSAALASVLSRVETTSLFTYGTKNSSWGRHTNPRALLSSLLFQGAIVAGLMLLGTNDAVRTRITQMSLIAPVPVKQLRPAHPRTNAGGGGGQRSPLPPLKGNLPKPAPKVFTIPLATIEHPALVMDASMIAAPDVWATPNSIGNPLGVLNAAGGLGSRGGNGDGVGTGIGDNSGSGTGDRGDAGIYSVGNGTTPPSVLSKVDPEYSEEARKAKYSGAVLLSIVVNSDGHAEGIKVVRSLGMGLDEKAIEAVRQWRFVPGKNKGVPVKVRAQIEVNFRLL